MCRLIYQYLNSLNIKVRNPSNKSTPYKIYRKLNLCIFVTDHSRTFTITLKQCPLCSLRCNQLIDNVVLGRVGKMKAGIRTSIGLNVFVQKRFREAIQNCDAERIEFELRAPYNFG